jgi:hypothetical protein
VTSYHTGRRTWAIDKGRQACESRAVPVAPFLSGVPMLAGVPREMLARIGLMEFQRLADGETGRRAALAALGELPSGLPA